MGASGWNYFTPYRDDVEQALEELHQRVFANKEFGDPAQKPMDISDEMLANMPPAQRANVLAIVELQKQALAQLETARSTQPIPQTIDELREQCAEEGTHSILDIYSVSDEPEFGCASPMPEQMVLQIYGTAEPTREQIEEKAFDATEDIERGQCWYTTVFKGGQPNELYFEGCSGD